MKTEIQTVAGATNWDGTAGKGLFTFDHAGRDEDLHAVVHAIGFTSGAALGTWAICFQHPSGGDSGQIKLADEGTLDPSKWYFPDGPIVVPKAADGTPFELIASSSGKTANGQMTVVWHLARYGS